MREILFKGKLLGTGEWSYGNLVVKQNGIFLTTPDETPIGKYGQVDPSTAGQYTGWNDKNNVRIFEGDVVAILCGEQRFLGRVEFSERGFWAFVPLSKEDFFLQSEDLADIDPSLDLHHLAFESEDYDGVIVVGNIHDNPDLLEGRRNGYALRPAANESIT